MKKNFALFLWLFFLLPSYAADSINDDVFDEGKVGFGLNIDGVITKYAVMAVVGLPSKVITLKLDNIKDYRDFTLTQDDVSIPVNSLGGWTYVMPKEPGYYKVNLHNRITNESMDLNVFVQVPFSQLDEDYSLENYKIGEYPLKPLGGLRAYLPPEGFIKVTPDLLDIKVSPHFSLGQFLCKQESDFPKFVVLNQKILFKLEEVLTKVNASGISASSFTLMSAYRTPFYNHAIGQGQHSRHQWGDAVDIFIDESPKDGVMDDINNDGLVNQADAAYLYQLIDKMDFSVGRETLIGGLGDYSANAAHGPFVHMDTRGYRARWGNSVQ